MKATPEQILESILQVRGGTLTALAAAQRLGFSRKTYYQWEDRALRGMLAALQPGHPGRPSTAPPAPQARLQEELQRTQAELDVERLRRHIHDTLAGTSTRAKKKSGGNAGG